MLRLLLRVFLKPMNAEEKKIQVALSPKITYLTIRRDSDVPLFRLSRCEMENMNCRAYH